MIQELLKTVTRALDQKGIGYMISGSLALNVYCIPRMTMDIDIVTTDADRQIQDIKMLMALPEIDKKYIISWCNKLNLKTFDLFKNT